MTQVELVEACGMKLANLCRLKNGNETFSVATLSPIAQDLSRKLEMGIRGRLSRLARRFESNT